MDKMYRVDTLSSPTLAFPFPFAPKKPSTVGIELISSCTLWPDELRRDVTLMAAMRRLPYSQDLNCCLARGPPAEKQRIGDLCSFTVYVYVRESILLYIYIYHSSFVFVFSPISM